MRSLFYYTMLVATANLFTYVQTAPLRIGNAHELDKGKHLDNIQQATIEANKQVDNMKKMLETGGPELHKHLTNAFGEGYNKDEITKVVNRLAKGAIDVGPMNVETTGENKNVIAKAVSTSSSSKITFTKNFHDMNPAARAGNIIHEATHALAGTKDHFVEMHDGSHLPIEKADREKYLEQGLQVHRGYIKADFPQLKGQASNVMHKNADSYKMFAHTATNGLGAPLPGLEKPKGCCIQ